MSWLMHRTGITRGAAVGHSAWAKRVGEPSAGGRGAGRGAGHRVRRAADLPVDGKLPREYRDDADEVL